MPQRRRTRRRTDSAAPSPLSDISDDEEQRLLLLAEQPIARSARRTSGAAPRSTTSGPTGSRAQNRHRPTSTTAVSSSTRASAPRRRMPQGHATAASRDSGAAERDESDDDEDVDYDRMMAAQLDSEEDYEDEDRFAVSGSDDDDDDDDDSVDYSYDEDDGNDEDRDDDDDDEEDEEHAYLEEHPTSSSSEEGGSSDQWWNDRHHHHEDGEEEEEDEEPNEEGESQEDGGGDDDDDEEDFAWLPGARSGSKLSSRSQFAPELRMLMRKILRLEELIERPPAEDTTHRTPEQRTFHKQQLRATQLLHLSRIGKVLQIEHRFSSDVYAMSLDYHDRSCFEHLTHLVQVDHKFCEWLESAGFAVDNHVTRPSTMPRSLNFEDLIQLTLPTAMDWLSSLRGTTGEAEWNKYVEEWTDYALARLSHYVTYMVTEGTRQGISSIMSVSELLPQILRESNHRKRLVPLSLVFSLFDQDESAVGEAMSQGLVPVLLARLRQLAVGLRPGGMLKRNLHDAAAEDEEHNRASPLLQPYSTTQQRSLVAQDPLTLDHAEDHLPSAAPPSVSSTTDVSTTTATATSTTITSGSVAVPLRKRPREEPSVPSAQLLAADGISAVATTDTPPPRPPPSAAMLPSSATAAPTTTSTASSLFWTPAPGDIVARGPQWPLSPVWHQPHAVGQGARCDFAKVIAVTTDAHVVVEWITSPDNVEAASLIELARGATGRRLYRYQFLEGNRQVLSLRDYIQHCLVTPHSFSFVVEEVLLISAILGILCNQRDAVLPCLQLHTVEVALRMIEIDLDASKRAFEAARDALLLSKGVAWEEPALPSVSRGPSAAAATNSQPAAPAAGATEEGIADPSPSTKAAKPAKRYSTDTAELLMLFDETVSTLRDQYRVRREIVARGLWILNALTTHKKLVAVFLEKQGLERLLHLSEHTTITSNLYGSGLVLSQLARPSVFEEILPLYHQKYFSQLMNFVLRHMEHENHDVRGAMSAFLFHVLSFPIALQYFDEQNGAVRALRVLERTMERSSVTHDVVHPNLSLVTLKGAAQYLIAHLLLASRVAFRRDRGLSAMLNRGPMQSLPRDAHTIESVFAALTNPSLLCADTSREAVLSLLTPEKLGAIARLFEENFHVTVLQCAVFYHDQDRFDLLLVALSVMRLLVIAPFGRPLLSDAQLPSSSSAPQSAGLTQPRGIPILLSVMEDYNATSRESTACVIAALQTLLLLITPPLEQDDAAVIAAYQRACQLVRTNDGIRVFLGLLKPPRDPNSVAMKALMFPVVAHVLHVLVYLLPYGDTTVLFDVLGVKRIARDILTTYRDARRDVAALGSRKKTVFENESLARFMEHAKMLMVGGLQLQQLAANSAAASMSNNNNNNNGAPHTLALPGSMTSALQGGMSHTHSGSAGAGGGFTMPSMRSLTTDPFEMMERQAIVARSHIDFTKGSLLQLIAQFLDQEGLTAASTALRSEAKSLLPAPPASPLLGASGPFPVNSATAPGSPLLREPLGGVMPTTRQRPTLDGIVHNYLRHHQENCSAPIATLPKFDLTKPVQPAMYAQRSLHSAQQDNYNNINNRLLFRKGGGLRSWREYQPYETTQFYRQQHALFDIRGGDEGLAAHCAVMCEDPWTRPSIMVGTSEGGIVVFDAAQDASEKLREQHIVFEEEALWDIAVSHDYQMVAAAGDNRVVQVMRRDAMPVSVLRLDDAKTSRFAPSDSSLVLVTNELAKSCSIYDLRRNATQPNDALVMTLSEGDTGTLLGLDNFKSVATFDRTGQLVLHDATLWDTRCAPNRGGARLPMFHFDRISESFQSYFHPNNRQVLIDDSVWDLRTMSMVVACPSLRQATISFTEPGLSAAGSVIFAFRDSTLSVLSSQTFDVVATHEIRGGMKSFAADAAGLRFAGIQTGEIDCVVRVYAFGFEPEDDAQGGPDPNEEDPDQEVDDSDDSDDSSDDGNDDDVSTTSEDDDDAESGSSYSSGGDDGEGSDEDTDSSLYEDDNSSDRSSLDY